MCHHLSRAERERLREIDAEYETEWLAAEEEEPIEEDPDSEPDPVPTPSD